MELNASINATHHKLALIKKNKLIKKKDNIEVAKFEQTEKTLCQIHILYDTLMINLRWKK